MPQHLLDRPQIGSLLQHMSAERVPQRMRMRLRGQPIPDSDLFYQPPDRPGRQPDFITPGLQAAPDE
jgi:hypothetical protein